MPIPHMAWQSGTHLQEHQVQGLLVDGDHISLYGPSQQGGLFSCPTLHWGSHLLQIQTMYVCVYYCLEDEA